VKRKKGKERLEKREFHEMYPPMSGAARERPRDVRSITDDVHAPKRHWRWRRSAFFYWNRSFYKGFYSGNVENEFSLYALSFSTFICSLERPVPFIRRQGYRAGDREREREGGGRGRNGSSRARGTKRFDRIRASLLHDDYTRISRLRLRGFPTRKISRRRRRNRRLHLFIRSRANS